MFYPLRCLDKFLKNKQCRYDRMACCVTTQPKKSLRDD